MDVCIKTLKDSVKNVKPDDKKYLINNKFIVKGWIRTYRKQNDICFMNINDGSDANGLQVISSKEDDIFTTLDKYNAGCYMKVEGLLVEAPASSKELVELKLLNIIDVGECNPNKYPLKKRIGLVKMREFAHLRVRSRVFGAIFRIRNTLMYETHNFYQSKKYLHLDPNMITVNECEGGAGAFQLTEWHPIVSCDIPIKESYIDWTQDHFKKPAYLTVSSQLQLEGLACGMGNVYTMNKSFRSEHSNTNKHVSEFTHLEIELIDCNNDDIMDTGKDHLNYIFNKVYETNLEDIKELNKFVSKGLLDRYEILKNLEFKKVQYKECIELLKKHKCNITYGDDISSEMEEFICKHYKSAVFVINWPSYIKSFYMKQNDDGTCDCFDLLMPYGIGELIGGSMREHRLSVLERNMKNQKVKFKGLEWYLDLRRYGTVKHGGFGMGIDRLLMLLTGIKNIKDVIPYPIYYQNCKY